MARPPDTPSRCGSTNGAGCSPANPPASGPANGFAGQVDAAGLEEGHLLRVAREVALGGVQQRAEQVRPHHGLILGERVGDRHAFGPRVAGGNPQPLRLAQGR